MKLKTFVKNIWKKYFNEFKPDLVISLGAACRSAHYMQKFGLRKGSFPLDWMMNYSLSDAKILFLSEFRIFFANIKQIDSKNGMRIMQDVDNGMISMHDFPLDSTIEAYHPIFKKKMKRRIERLFTMLKDSKNILFVCNRDESIENFKDFLESINAIYTANYTLINIRHTPNQNKILKKVIFKESIEYAEGGGGGQMRLIEYSFNDIHKNGDNPVLNPDFWLGNEECWDKIMDKITLRK